MNNYRMNDYRNQEKKRGFNTSGLVMLIISVVLLVSNCVSMALSKITGMDLVRTVVVSAILLAGGLFLLKHKMKFHWIIYIVAVGIGLAILYISDFVK